MKYKLLKFCIAVVAAGCTPQAQTPAPVPAASANERSVDFLSLVPRVIATVLARAPQDRPLLVDVESFVAAARSLGVNGVDSVQIGKAVGQEFLNVSTAEAVIRTGEFRFQVLSGGLHVSMESIARGEQGYEAVVTYRYTEDRGLSSAIGMARVALGFARSGNGWRIHSERVLGTT